MIERNLIDMKKIDMMDVYIDSYQGRITSSEICGIIKSVFEIDLETKPVLLKEFLGSGDFSLNNSAKSVINIWIAKLGKKISGAEIRKLINEVYGINLDAISSLDGAKISLFSKEQWVIQNEQDLFVVHTGLADVDVKIFPTDYFTKQTGLTSLPEELKQSLTSLGFYYDKVNECYYYSNPSGEAIPDSFKGQTIGAVLKVIQNSYQNL